MHRPAFITLIFVSLFCTPASAESRLTFEQHVRPIFKAQCFHCHGEDDELSGGLDVRLVRLLTAGGDSGPAVVPHDVEASLLWERIAADEMPEGPKKLSSEQKATIQLWIEQGARTARPEPNNIADARFSLEELQHWAYQPITRPEIPNLDIASTAVAYDLRTPVDGFIARRLAEHQLGFSPVADRRTLIRRVTFGLLGLPPRPAEVERFLADKSPDAYERMVDRLLASPQFGVRWGRHWLDVAGFSESDGGPQDSDRRRPHAWRYRDYVIDAINRNKPIDEFFIEQLAGDELIVGEVDIHDPRHLELLTATGFLRMAPDPTQRSNSLADRNMAAADALKVISSAMLGLTVGCAQCHDHKYDPIGIEDYYRFRAVFDPVFPLQDWQQPTARLVDFTTDEERAAAEQIEVEAKSLEADLQARRKAHAEEIFAKKLADVPQGDREATRAAVLTEPGKRTDKQRALLDQYPMVKPVSFIAGFLVEYDNKKYREFQEESAKIADLRATKPPPRMVMVTRERPNVVPTSTILFRGDPAAPRGVVSPSELMVLTRHDRDVDIPDNHTGPDSTGRRLAYARQLTDGTHPLAARVFVNRIWLHHVGRGLVATPGDFGISGEPPSHPDLLDWLADDFRRHGWDQKRLHRMILGSTTYQQSSRRRPELDAVDPENRLVGRMNLRRLEAEAIRDAILSVTGERNDRLRGPSVPVTENPEGKVVIGRRQIRDGLKAGVDASGADDARRSVYIEVQRQLPLNMLATFDQPEMNPSCDLRRATTVATQSLWFLNDTIIVELSQRLARSLMETYGTNEQRVEELFLRMFAVPPDDQQMKTCREFLAAQQVHYRTSAGEDSQGVGADKRALAALCQTLFASNRFLYID